MSLRRKFFTFATVVGVAVLGGGLASAADNGSQTVSYTLAAARSLTLSSATATLPSVGLNDSTGVTSSDAGTVSYLTDGATDKVTAVVDATVTGATLKVTTGTASGGTCTTMPWWTWCWPTATCPPSR